MIHRDYTTIRISVVVRYAHIQLAIRFINKIYCENRLLE